MTTQALARPGLRRVLVWSVALAGLWVGVALIRPTSTFHLAPLLIAAAAPVLFTLDGDNRAEWATVLRLAAGGIALALAATFAVSVLGAMQGPPFEGFSGPLVEAVVLTAVGAAAGIGFAWWRQR
ncbi:MAG: hypothetical protein WBN35_13000 [Acidimicrobiia bacterium]